MKQVSTTFLKLAIILMGIPVLLLCIFLVPKIGNDFTNFLPEYPYIKFLLPSILYASSIPFYFALYQAFNLLRYIDNNNAFSELSVIALKKIKYCAVTISGLHVLLLPILYLFADKDDAPGMIIVGLLIPFASLVIAFFAAVLQKLLQEAIDIKTENDLTVWGD